MAETGIPKNYIGALYFIAAGLQCVFFLFSSPSSFPYAIISPLFLLVVSLLLSLAAVEFASIVFSLPAALFMKDPRWLLRTQARTLLLTIACAIPAILILPSLAAMIFLDSGTFLEFLSPFTAIYFLAGLAELNAKAYPFGLKAPWAARAFSWAKGIFSNSVENMAMLLAIMAVNFAATAVLLAVFFSGAIPSSALDKSLAVPLQISMFALEYFACAYLKWNGSFDRATKRTDAILEKHFP